MKVTPGHAYKFRVLAINRVGESDLSAFSDVIVAATVPARPDQPRLVSATSTSITLEFDKVSDNGGSAISNYNLYIDVGTEQAHDFQNITTYDRRSLTWTVEYNQVVPTLVTGTKYRFKVSAVNIIGEGELSNYVTIALANPASPPTKPTVDRSLSSLTSLFIEWTEGTPGDIPIDGYQMFMIEIATGIVT